MTKVDAVEWAVLVLGTLVSIWGAALAARSLPRFPPAWYVSELGSLAAFIFLLLGDVPILLAAVPVALGFVVMMMGTVRRGAGKGAGR